MKNLKELKGHVADPQWILRLGIFGTFLGHGIFALQIKKNWIPYFAAAGIGETTAQTLMPIIGAMDVAVAFVVLFYPLKFALAWAFLWGFTTALIRPLSGEPIWDFVERWANWAAPLALLALQGFPKKMKE
ncbi:hypothetical protein HYX13_02785 [Candidatus Woesearchaeota archaeon]|nr:hypothetical protein [Candidatus Woesearchaeota archaeon]